MTPQPEKLDTARQNYRREAKPEKDSEGTWVEECWSIWS